MQLEGDFKVPGGRVFIHQRGFLCVLLLSLSFPNAAPAWSQITASDDALTLSPDSANRSSSGGLSLQRVPQNAHGSTITIGTGFKYDDSTSSDATREVAAPDDDSGKSTASHVIEQTVTEVNVDPRSALSSLPPTLTVSTAALLELHAMRKNAVDLCIQLPAKYRTRLPECAEIFKHEIRLQGLAKKHN